MTVAPAPPDIAEASVRVSRKGRIQDLSLDRDRQDAWLLLTESQYDPGRSRPRP